ncbi:MAG: autotransporter domain-containing protein [Pontiella sp.]
MKYVLKKCCKNLSFCAIAIAATFSTIHARAQLFDTGTIVTNSTSTAYGSSLIIGSETSNNGLIVNNGSVLSAPDVLIGEFSSTNNLLSIQDNGVFIAGTADTNGLSTGGIIVGDFTKSAAFTANNSAIIETDYLYIGFGTNDSGTVEISGEGTEFNVSENAFIGRAGSTNDINVRNGAALIVAGTLNIGSDGGSNNHVNIYSDSSLSVNTTNDINVVNAEDGDNSISIKQNGTLKIGGDVDTSTLEGLGVDLSVKSNLEVGGSLDIENDSLDNRINIILNNELSTNSATWLADSQTVAYIGETSSDNTLTLTNGATGRTQIAFRLGNASSSARNMLSVGGSNSSFVAEQNVIIGATGNQNEINVTDQGTATFDKNLTLGQEATANDNQFNIGGTNTTASVGGNLIIGNQGDRNALNVYNEASLVVTGNLSLGERTGSDDNTFTLSGSNTSVTVGGNLVAGSQGIGNSISLNGGTTTVTGEFIIGETKDATGETGFVDDDSVETTGNIAIVGEGATLNIQQNLTVGLEGGGSILALRDGGAANIDGDVIIGEGVGDNYIYLQRGSNTLLNVTGDLIVGKEGGNNRFATYGGTANIDGNLYLGSSTNQHDVKNFIHIETTNAVVNIANAIYIGASNSLNTLDIVDGAQVTAQDLFVGNNAGVSNNAVTITGTDSRMNVQNNVFVGAGGNTIQVENDAWLAIGELGNTNLPSSTGGAISVGNDSGTAILSVNENSSVEAGSIYLGVSSNHTGLVAISGSNATLSASQDLVVGVDGSSNTLSIADGAKASGNLVIGMNDGANSNTVNMAGTDSSFEAASITIGGDHNFGNMLNLTNGAMVVLTGDLNIATNNALNVNRGATFKTTGDFNLTSRSTNNFNFNEGAALEVGGTLIATNVVEGGRTIVLDGGQWDVGTNLIIGANTDSNYVGVTGSGALLTATDIEIGSTNNTLLIGNGGTVRVENNLMVADGNTLNISSNGTLEVVGDFDTHAPSVDNFIFGSNATLKVGGTLTTSTNQNTISKGQTIVLTGSTNYVAQWDVGNDLYIGGTNGSGTLSILDGGLVENISAFIGSTNGSTVKVSGAGSLWTVSSNLTVGMVGSGNALSITGGATNDVNFDAIVGYGDSSNNTVTVSGKDSLWDIGHNLTIGGSALEGNNWLQVLEGANVSVGNNMELNNGSILEIGTNSTVSVTGNYTQDATSQLNIIAGKKTVGLLEVGATATFTNDTSIKVKSAGDLNYDENFKYTIIDAGSLILGGITNGTNTNILKFVGSLIGASNYVVGSTLVIEGTAASMAAIIGEEGTGSQLESVANEVDSLGTLEAISQYSILSQMETAQANQAMDNYYGEKSSSIPANNVINLGLQSVAEQLTMRADNTRSRNGAASASINWDKPNGVSGPHESDQKLQGWISAFGTRSTKDSADGFNGYDATLSGFMIGADLAVSENILVGVAGGTGNGSIDKENNANTDTKTKYAAIYASAGTKNWFADASIIYGSTAIDSTLGSTFDTTADYSANNLAFYFGGGKELLSNYLIFTPQASLLGNYYTQDDYRETATTTVGRNVESFDAFYLQSSLGGSLGVYTTLGDVTFKPEIRAFWLHEWNAEDESLGYSLIGGTGNYTMLLQAPEKDIITIGIGSSAKLGDYLELRADLDTRQGTDYSDYTLLGSLRYQF